MELNTAVGDYAKAFTSFTDIGHYFTINISCPNAEGGQPFVDADKLHILLDSLDKIYTSKPVFIKLSPDITLEKVDTILDVAKKHRVHGIIVTNLTKKRDNPAILDLNIPAHGGISGKPVQSMSDDLIAHIYKRESGRFVIIGCGGIFTAEDAYRKIRLGATLLQLITGMIYQGPQVIGEINRGIVRLLSRDGYANISEAIGAAHNKQK
jgi:dihydroorotate dehydrogenase